MMYTSMFHFRRILLASVSLFAATLSNSLGQHVINQTQGVWEPLEVSLEIQPGSAFDFSSLADAPAGNHGYLKYNNAGDFYFEGSPNQSIRFWGVNLCFTANFLSKEQSDQLAERLVRSGYNVVRFHHFDGYLQVPGSDFSLGLAPENLNKLDYLFYTLKKRGIYVVIDLYTSRKFTPQELSSLGLKPGTGIAQRFKALFPISETAYELWSGWALHFLQHRNPYTGMTWAEDPALIGICPVNEDTLAARINYDPAIRKQYEELFSASNRTNGQSNETSTVDSIDPSSVGADNYAEEGIQKNETKDDTSSGKDSAFNRFVYDTQRASDKRVRTFLRGLGYKGLITGSNFYSYQGQAWLREHYDYVDNHLYWDHPKFLGKGWSVPFGFRQANSVALGAYWAPRGMMPTRIIGLPFAISEFRFVRPNRYRSQGGILMSAYASLQGWDAMFNFDYAWSRDILDGSGVGSTFSLAADPIGLLGDRLAAVLFRRGDIRTSQEKYIAFVPEAKTAFRSLKTNFYQDFTQLGLVTRIGSIPADSDLLQSQSGNIKAVVINKDATKPASLSAWSDTTFKVGPKLPEELMQAGLIPTNSISADGTRYLSDTGEIELNSSEQMMKVITPRSELFVLPPHLRAVGHVVEVANGPEDCSLYVISVDGQSLKDSKRVLIVLLTDTLPEGMTFTDEERTRLEAWGKLPQLVASGEVELTVHMESSNNIKWRAWALSTSGKRLREIPLREADGTITITLKTIGYGGTQLAYELAHE